MTAPGAAGGATASPAPTAPRDAAADDEVQRAYLGVLAVLVQFGDRVLDAARDAKGVDVEDVRAQMLGGLRAQLAVSETGVSDTAADGSST